MNLVRTYYCEAGHRTESHRSEGDPFPDSMRCSVAECPHSCQIEPGHMKEPMPFLAASLPSGPLLADVGMELGEWIGAMLPGMQFALDAISAHRWSERDRDDVIHRMGGILVDGFEAIGNGYEPNVEDLEREAQHALAMYVAAKARAVVKRQRQARA